MKLNTLLLLTLCGILHAKIMVLDDFSELRQLQMTGIAGKTFDRSKHIAKIKKKFQPYGYENGEGYMWNVLCESKEHGKVPGKMNERGFAYYTVDKNLYSCYKPAGIKDKLIPSSQKLSRRCKEHGKQKNKKKYFAAIILSSHGAVPGKATRRPKQAWYYHEGQVYKVTDNFFYLC